MALFRFIDQQTGQVVIPADHNDHPTSAEEMERMPNPGETLEGKFRVLSGPPSLTRESQWNGGVRWVTTMQVQSIDAPKPQPPAPPAPVPLDSTGPTVAAVTAAQFKSKRRK